MTVARAPSGFGGVSELEGADRDDPGRRAGTLRAVLESDRWRPDLLVVGSHGRSAAVLGSVSQKVLSHAFCPVPRGAVRYDPARLAGEPVRVVLGIDGSVDSAAAAMAVAAAGVAGGVGGASGHGPVDPRLAMVLALPTGTGLWTPAYLRMGGSEERAHRIVEDVAKDLAGNRLAASPVLSDGDPKRAGSAKAEYFKADCIVVGAQGHSALSRFLLAASRRRLRRGRIVRSVVRQG